tara:strand:- start:42 stop:575 length:534 start_codon:yes stop_codon:yes gene_type:complete
VYGTIPVLKKGITGNNIIAQMDNHSSYETRLGQGGDFYLDLKKFKDEHSIHNNTRPLVLETPHHHISPRHLVKSTRINNPSFRGNVILLTHKKEEVMLSIRITNDNVLRLLLNDMKEVFRMRTTEMIGKKILNKSEKYRRLSIKSIYENRLIDYIKVVIKKHYSLSRAISDLTHKKN